MGCHLVLPSHPEHIKIKKKKNYLMFKNKCYCFTRLLGIYPEGHDIHAATSACWSVTHGATVALRCDQLLAVGQQLTLDLITHSHTIVAYTYAARLWLPDVIVLVDQAINSAVLGTNLLGFRGVSGNEG